VIGEVEVEHEPTIRTRTQIRSLDGVEQIAPPTIGLAAASGIGAGQE